MKRFISRSVEILKNARSPREVFMAAVRALFRNEAINIYSIELDKLSDSSCPVSAREIRRGHVEELEGIRKQVQEKYWELYCDLYDGAREYYVCDCNGAIAHISWIYYYSDPNRVIRLAENEAEVKYSLTIPEHRGKGIYPDVLGEIQKYLKGRGFQRMYICTADENRSSARGIEKAGFSFVKKIALVKLFGVQVSRRYAATNR